MFSGWKIAHMQGQCSCFFADPITTGPVRFFCLQLGANSLTKLAVREEDGGTYHVPFLCGDAVMPIKRAASGFV